tara:strand:- start:40 stop:666 length:627 start_codon:yes stop_codon:yes gene_type:complete
MKRVIIGCEYSGIVRDAFIRQGFDAWSCDLLDSEAGGNHYKCDVLDVINDGWDLAIFHPPCTRLCNSGVVWLEERNLWKELDKSALFFKSLLESSIPNIAIENPIPHKYALERIGYKYSQIIQPYMFGHKERKATCLWLKDLPKLIPTNNVEYEMLKLPKNKQQRLHYLPPSEDRWKERSKTFTGIADAMAEQWGDCIINGSKQLSLF